MFIKYQLKENDFQEVAKIDGVTRQGKDMLFSLVKPVDGADRIVVKDVSNSTYDTIVANLYEDGKANIVYLSEYPFKRWPFPGQG